MPWNVYHSTFEGLCPGTPCRPIVEGSCPVNALTIQNVEGSCAGMPCHSNALNGTTCMCIVALSLFVVVSLRSRCRRLSCCVLLLLVEFEYVENVVIHEVYKYIEVFVDV